MLKKRIDSGRKSYHFGRISEKIAMFYLICKGYKILKWRYKTYFGEIDLIAKKPGIIVIIEVKATRVNKQIEEVLLPKQVKRIRAAAEYFVAKHQCYQAFKVRFDLIKINRFFLPKHYQNFIS